MVSCRSFNLLHQWWIPASKFPLRRSSMLPKASPAIYFCRESKSVTAEVFRKSFVPGSENVLEITKQEKSFRKHEPVGAFQKLPMVMPAIEILSSARRKARKVSPTKGIANIAKRERNRGAKQLDALMKELAVPLREYAENFPNKRYLHPYEQSLIELTLGEGNYEEVLGRINSLRKKLLFVGKEHASLCAQSLSKREAEERLSEGVKKLEEVFHIQGQAIDDLLNVAKNKILELLKSKCQKNVISQQPFQEKLRAMPVVDPRTPTLCLVGAPNVGKSSLVRILSTGKPEICNYPFTTRAILMGHIVIDYERFQVTDTPGLLKRHDDDRNNLEKLTLAVLSHLPTAILYVHDLSGECGTSPSDQFITYNEVKDRFKDHLWLDVVSKYDLLQETQSIIVKGDKLGRYERFGPDGAICVSVKTQRGIDELKGRVHDLLISQMARIRSEKEEES